MAVGYVDTVGEGLVGMACRIGASGKIDSSFAVGSLMPGCLIIEQLSAATSVSVRSDAGLVISGVRFMGDDHSELAIVHISETGVLDGTFANGLGVARLPTGYVSNSQALKTVLSPDDTITTLAFAGEAQVLVRHASNGAIDETFATGGAMTAAQFSNPLGFALGDDGSMFLVVNPYGEYVRDLTLMKFESDGSPSLAFNGPNSPPGQSRITVCDGSCVVTPSSQANNLLRVSGGNLLLGGAVYYTNLESTRPIAVRVNETTGMPDPAYGDIGDDALLGVGRGIALPGKLVGFTSVLRGDRLTLVGNLVDGGTRVMTAGFLGDRLMADGFE